MQSKHDSGTGMCAGRKLFGFPLCRRRSSFSLAVPRIEHASSSRSPEIRSRTSPAFTALPPSSSPSPNVDLGSSRASLVHPPMPSSSVSVNPNLNHISMLQNPSTVFPAPSNRLLSSSSVITQGMHDLQERGLPVYLGRARLMLFEILPTRESTYLLLLWSFWFFSTT